MPVHTRARVQAQLLEQIGGLVGAFAAEHLRSLQALAATVQGGVAGSAAATAADAQAICAAGRGAMEGLEVRSGRGRGAQGRWVQAGGHPACVHARSAWHARTQRVERLHVPHTYTRAHAAARACTGR